MGDEVEDVTAASTLSETIPDVLAQAHPELRRIRAFVNRAGTGEAVTASLELVEQAVVLKHLLHGDGGFYRLEVNEL